MYVWVCIGVCICDKIQCIVKVTMYVYGRYVHIYMYAMNVWHMLYIGIYAMYDMYAMYVL